MTHSLLNQFRDKADRTYDSNSERRGAFVEGACYAAANFHGIQLGGFEALPVADPMPTYADIEHKVETVAASRGLSDRPLGRKAFKNGAKWVLETFTPPMIDRLDAIKTEASKSFFGASDHLCKPFIDGACFATARFHGMATRASMVNPKYEEFKETISQAASAAGYSYGFDLREEHIAFRHGAKWILDNFSPAPVVKDFAFTHYSPIAIEVTSDGKFAATAAMGDSVRTTLLEFTIPKDSPWNLEDVLRRLNGVK